MRVPNRKSIGVAAGQGRYREAQSAAVPGAFGEQVGNSLSNLATATMALGQFVKDQEDRKTKFTALRQYTEFEVQQKMLLNDATREATPGDPAFYETQQQLYKVAEQEFIANLPPDLQEEFRVRTTELGGSLGLSAAQYQYEANDIYFKEGIQNAVDTARTEVSQDASKENLERQRLRVDEVINAAGVSEAERNASRRKAYQGLEGVAYRQAQLERLRAENAGSSNDVEQATDLLITLGNVNPDQAADTALQAAQEAQALFGGIDNWAALPSRIRAALVMAQATTGIPQEAIAAVADGDLNALADALRGSGAETAGDLILNPEAGLDNDPTYANVPYEDRLTLLADAQRQLTAEVSAEKTARTAQNEQIINSLLTGIHDGTMGQMDIEAARSIGVLTDYDDIVRAEKALADRDEALRFKALGLQMMEGGVTFAPGNTDHAKALNAVVGEDGLKAIESKDGEYAANTLIPLVRNAGAVPGDVVDLLRGMIRKDGDTAYWALDLMSQIKRTDEKAFAQFPEADQKSLDFWEARRDYLPQDEMIKALNGPMDTGERQGRSALREAGMKLFTGEDGPMKDFNPLTLFDGGWFGGGRPTIGGMPWVGAQLGKDFQDLFLDAYELSGDQKYAEEAAKEQLKRVWGVTNTGADNKLMRYPPEQVYPTVRESHDWMEQQLRRDGLLLDNEQFELVSDDQTEAERGIGAPSYLFVKIVDGRQTLQFDANGLPLRVNFDYGAEEQMDESKWREEQRKMLEATDAQRMLGAAVQHELESGTQIPQEMFDGDMPGGILDHLMNDDPTALSEAEQRVRETLFPTGPVQGGIATGQYRLP